MNCEETRDNLGSYVDGELPIEVLERLSAHLEKCDACRGECEDLRSLAGELAEFPVLEAPRQLWAAIESRLGRQETQQQRFAPGWVRGSLRIAAAIVLIVGLGSVFVAWPGGTEQSVLASTVDFSVILDALPKDPEKAFSRFLDLYKATSIQPSEARAYAPGLDYEAPETLSNGFQRVEMFALRLGERPGIAVRYDRDGELLVTIFHAPVFREDFGTHRDYPCVIGKHRGHKVSVGEWSLVHVTDPSTCRCVLSRLDESTELPLVLSQVAPRSAAP